MVLGSTYTYCTFLGVTYVTLWLDPRVTTNSSPRSILYFPYHDQSYGVFGFLLSDTFLPVSIICVPCESTSHFLL